MISHQDVCKRIEREIQLVGSLRKTAANLGVSSQYLSDVLLGKRGIGPKLAASLNLSRHKEVVMTYQPIPAAKERHVSKTAR